MAGKCQEIVDRFFAASQSQSEDNSLLRKYIELEKRRPFNENNSILIQCDECKSSGVESRARGFLVNGNPLKIVICANKINYNSGNNGKEEIKEIVLHELVHANDFRSNVCDFSTCEGLAYTEVKAARAAECASSGQTVSTFLSADLGETIRRNCIRDKAIKSTANLFGGDAATRCVDAALDHAMADFAPFENDKPDM